MVIDDGDFAGIEGVRYTEKR